VASNGGPRASGISELPEFTPRFTMVSFRLHWQLPRRVYSEKGEDPVDREYSWLHLSYLFSWGRLSERETERQCVCAEVPSINQKVSSVDHPAPPRL